MRVTEYLVAEESEVFLRDAFAVSKILDALVNIDHYYCKFEYMN